MKGLSQGVAVALLLAGCGSQPTSVSFPKHSPTASGTASPAATDSSSPVGQGASPGAAPAATPQVMTCKLPVVLDAEAGWVTFPGGTYQRDPKADHLPAGSTLPLSKAYDRAYARWVPVIRDLISPDGQHYAYSDSTGTTIHVIDLANNADHAFRPAAPPPDSVWVAIDYETEGVYFEQQPNGPAAPAGLWLLTPSTGSVKQITTNSVQYISGGGAWGTSEPLTGHGPGPGSRLVHTDLRSGATVSWYKRTDIEFTVAGADAGGHPVLQVWKGGAAGLVAVTGQDAGSQLAVAPGSAVPELSNVVHPVSDAHGMWLGDTAGKVSLYTPLTGIKKLAQVGTGDVGIGGGCH
ncbi:MAG: hypothetical protein M3Z11_00175 [Candidatus Dormibacteraeota bacterium]|nr:hypothetical protein [Candidatus Dormibacteraeota bacterium]